MEPYELLDEQSAANFLCGFLALAAIPYSFDRESNCLCPHVLGRLECLGPDFAKPLHRSDLWEESQQSVSQQKISKEAKIFYLQEVTLIWTTWIMQWTNAARVWLSKCRACKQLFQWTTHQVQDRFFMVRGIEVWGSHLPELQILVGEEDHLSEHELDTKLQLWHPEKSLHLKLVRRVGNLSALSCFHAQAWPSSVKCLSLTTGPMMERNATTLGKWEKMYTLPTESLMFCLMNQSKLRVKKGHWGLSSCNILIACPCLLARDLELVDFLHAQFWAHIQNMFSES